MPLCVTPYASGVYVLGCMAKREHFVTSPVDGRFPAGALTRKAPRFLSRARRLAALKPTHISHPQSEAYQLDPRGRWWEQKGEAVAQTPCGPLGCRTLPPRRRKLSVTLVFLNTAAAASGHLLARQPIGVNGAPL
jgi:hypothetical protein